MNVAAMPLPSVREGGLFSARDTNMIRGQILLGLTGFAIGCLAGLAQALDRILPPTSTIWRFFPFQENYYQGLTMHGVLMAFVFMFAFSNGFMTLVHHRSLGRRPITGLLVGSLACAVLGTLLAGGTIMANQASVLFTMYPPLQAHPLYYLGAVLLVVSTWLTAADIFISYRGWRAQHPGERIPLQAFTVIATYAMWAIASIGVAIEVLVLLLPWSLGLVEKTDPELARTLFWFSGHAIVYFWLLPAYVSWYTMAPKQAGGRLPSDALTRLVFILFLLLSIPTGLHHQYTDPGLRADIKLIHLVLTFGVFFPSMITAFTLMMAFEDAGRRRGGTGLLGWIRTLPWGSPVLVAQLLAMLGFVLGGISGIVNASYNVNLVVHNTAWIPGHFHLTVGTAVTLTLLGISYWLIPHLYGRALWGRRVALAQAWMWFIGVLIFSRAQIVGGLAGLPRRLNMSTLPESYAAAIEGLASSNLWTAVGGTIMFISAVLFFVVIGMTLWRGEAGAIEPMPVAEAMRDSSESWPLLDNWKVWVGVAVALIVLAYGPVFLTYTPNFVSPGDMGAFGGG